MNVRINKSRNDILAGKVVFQSALILANADNRVAVDRNITRHKFFGKNIQHIGVF